MEGGTGLRMCEELNTGSNERPHAIMDPTLDTTFIEKCTGSSKSCNRSIVTLHLWPPLFFNELVTLQLPVALRRGHNNQLRRSTRRVWSSRILRQACHESSKMLQP
jgi:hypothetical protein